MMLRTAFISPKQSPVPFITKLLAVKNRPEAKAITHPIILRPHSSKLLIRITDHNNFFLRNLKLSISIFVDLYFFLPFFSWMFISFSLFICKQFILENIFTHKYIKQLINLYLHFCDIGEILFYGL